jgi:carbonic anhydrase
MNMARLLTQPNRANCVYRALVTWRTGHRILKRHALVSAALLALISTVPLALSAQEVLPALAEHSTPMTKVPMKVTANTNKVTDQVREAADSKNLPGKRLTLVVNGKEKKFITLSAPEQADTPETPPAHVAKKPIAEKVIPPVARANVPNLHAGVTAGTLRNRGAVQVKIAPTTTHEKALASVQPSHAAQVHWTYEGETGPQAWGNLSNEFNICAIGKRQSPINIREATTLQGPAEPLHFNYQPSNGSVVNNGHTIQVNLSGENTLTVRGSLYKLLQFHFHTPSEERVNGQNFAMVAHLVHKNAEGQLAVVAVLLEAGVANSLINNVWTYMPLESGDQVGMPSSLIDMNELLPKDQRYYQFMGSLTTPPCTEGVLWMVMKQATPMSKEQIRLFTQIFPNNARPVQAVNGRAVRDAQ